MPRPNASPLPSATWTMIVGDADLARNLPIGVSAEVPPVLATSRMILLMEFAAAACLAPVLDEGELSVGLRVDVHHTAATLAGVTVIATARYLGKEGKRYLFEVTASDPAGEIGSGRHERGIIDEHRLLAGAERRQGS